MISSLAYLQPEEDKGNLPKFDTAEKSNGCTITDLRVTPNAVQNKLAGLDPNKANGPDNIPARLLKELSKELSLPYCLLFNKSLESGEIPLDWKKANVKAIFKKGTRSDPGNYRPVSLTSISCKILESFIRDAIVDHMKSNKLYSQCQHGFRRHRSCITQLLEVMEDFTKLIENERNIDIIYLDFKKAFDSVPHERLLIKLESYGITGNINLWIRDFLNNRQQKVRVSNSYSEEAKVLSGIPQGSILGPVLFTLFINDLPDNLSSTCKIFADDTKMYNTPQNQKDIQDDLNRLTDWSKTWKLFFNTSKCKVLHVGKSNPKYKYTMEQEGDETEVQECTQEKDLGVVFDNKLKFDLHVQSAINKANKMTGIIKRTFSFLDIPSFMRLYKAMIRPHLEYGNIIWSSSNLIRQSKAIENVQRRATKLLPAIKDLTYEARLRALKLPSLKSRRLRGDLIQTYKIINQVDDVDTNHFFKMANMTDNKSNITRKSYQKILHQQNLTNTRRYSFSHRVIKHWNSLPEHVKKAQNTNSFKTALDKQEMVRNTWYEFD